LAVPAPTPARDDDGTDALSVDHMKYAQAASMTIVNSKPPAMRPKNAASSKPSMI
jgi:hypothetical protein